MSVEFSIQWILLLLGLVIWFIIIPGTLLVYNINIENNKFLNIALLFPVGIIVFSFIGYLFEFSLEYINYTYFILNGLGGILTVINSKTTFSSLEKLIKNIDSDTFKDLVILTVSSISLFIISLHSNWYPRGDAAIHLQCIQNLIHNNYIVFPFYSLPRDPIIPDHTYDSYYVLLAIFHKNSGAHSEITKPLCL